MGSRSHRSSEGKVDSRGILVLDPEPVHSHSALWLNVKVTCDIDTISSKMVSWPDSECRSDLTSDDKLLAKVGSSLPDMAFIYLCDIKCMHGHCNRNRLLLCG